MQLNPSVISDIKNIIYSARDKAVRAVDKERVLMYWNIGKRIFEEEQEGKNRADYGKFLIKSISAQIQPEFGIGFSYRQLNWYRQFYRTFPIVSALRTQLTWTHYKFILGLDNQHKADFYITETVKNNWSSRQLERQIGSNLFERLLLSNDKDAVLAIAKKEKQTNEPRQIIKDPMYLEFLGLKKESSYYEKDIESAIITHLQEFLLELGNGFSFVARQKRIHLDGDDFYIDLVLYNRLLQCFVLVDLKTKKLTHGNIGQMQMYVNYYDRLEKLPSESPTLGILLCANKNDAIVKFTLPEDNKTIIASRYELYLPTEQQLITEINKEIKNRDPYN
ncbi:PDDEXK nuclease domain-containing protein [Pedobacter metabolipauper]|uniref:Putative nuclease of restriction endonuclease-like (RecB) superfamily n=1 Tax=Pedobacter metabolipauper TaxID=425513 RepID=A0A4R6SUQ0_9SPHI|nr:PDDEXK nuclease domain-containing protein [Pedobacter metabolipauper]TDQ08723.1 putative nuclease of restriction endonuclease-like (RecB) superfamily [Pedobacter metabolipauper]